MKERRMEPRLWCSDLIKVRVEGTPPTECIANLEDIAPSGASMLFERPVAVGARLSVRLGRHKFRGDVIYCRHDELGYFVGVKWDAGKLWSRKIYEPKHLLDPAQMVARGSGFKTNA